MEKLEIEVLCGLKVLPGKIEEFLSAILVLTSKVTTIEKIKLDIPARLLALPKQLTQHQKKTGDNSIPSACQAGTHLVEGEK
ncbi:hypothetical protein Tco_0182724 [Tanacetum coccineum]